MTSVADSSLGAADPSLRSVDCSERIAGFPPVEPFHSRVLTYPLYVPRQGIMLHYDDSGGDQSSLAWFRDPRCTNGYTWLVLRSGRVVELAHPAFRTPHAGTCLTPNANSAFYGIAASANGRTPATVAQVDTIVACCRALFAHHAWPLTEVATRIVGHDAQAIWNARNTSNRELWGKLGRKVDPTGQRPDRRPILDVAEVRRRVASK